MFCDTCGEPQPAPPPVAEALQSDLAAATQRLELERRFKSGANWFYWVAALSIINSLVLQFGGDLHFIFGLGVTQLMDAVLAGVLSNAEPAPLLTLIAVIIAAIPAAVCALLGYLARMRMAGFYMLGMILYVCDTLLFLLLMDILNVVFHGFVLFGMYGGFRAMRALNNLDRQSGDASACSGS